jgi:hypothetical protein
MTDQLVTKETAVLAKLKGFDGKCFAGYNEGITNPLWLHSDGKFESLSYRDKSTVTADCILVPTQSQLQKWLREVHHYHIEIHQIPIHPRYNFRIIWIFNGVQCKSGCGYESYEECLEAGLVEVLKLIK